MSKHNMVLTDSTIEPNDELIADGLGDSYHLWQNLVGALTSEEFGLALTWSYYTDSKVWLCKAVRGAKTMAWLSIGDGFAQTTIYFSQRHREGLANLPLKPALRRQITDQKMIGRMLPVPISIHDDGDVTDALSIIRFKRSAK